MPVKSLSQNISQAKEYGGSPCGLPRTVLANRGGPLELPKEQTRVPLPSASPAQWQLWQPLLVRVCAGQRIVMNFYNHLAFFSPPQTTQKEKLMFFDIVPKDLPEIHRISCLALTVVRPSFEASTLQSSSSSHLSALSDIPYSPTAVVSQ